ncbi:MAG: hypothetical protein J2P46_14800 [Zavarzinella sp.]|nr:hypothetical protein [Zavarzinella sp.]
MADKQTQRKLESLFPDDFPDLGKFRQIYSSEVPGQRIFTGVIMLIAAAGAVAMAVFVEPGNQADRPVVLGVLGAIFLGMGIGGGIMLWRGLKEQRRLFESGVVWAVYEDGLVAVSDGKPRAYRWADLEVWLQVIPMKVAIATHHEYVLRAAGKRKPIPIPPNMRQLRKVMADLQKRQLDVLLPGLRKRIKAGEAVRLGAFDISKAGIAADGESWPWDEVKKFNFQYDLDRALIVLDIHQRSGKASVDLSSTTPNLWLFFNVVREVCPRVAKGVSRPEKYLR